MYTLQQELNVQTDYQKVITDLIAVITFLFYFKRDNED